MYSCYNNAETKNLRKLRVKKKQLSNECNNKCDKHFDIILEHNSVVIFSVDINSKYLHSIILENDFPQLPQSESDNL